MGFVPLGDCYEASAHLLLERLHGDALLVHGFVTNPDDGSRHGHAWCELGPYVYDWSNNLQVVMPKDQYYRLGGILRSECTYYTRMKAIRLLLAHEHYGPWA